MNCRREGREEIAVLIAPPLLLNGSGLSLVWGLWAGVGERELAEMLDHFRDGLGYFEQGPDL